VKTVCGGRNGCVWQLPHIHRKKKPCGRNVRRYVAGAVGEEGAVCQVGGNELFRRYKRSFVAGVGMGLCGR
jgi:hypothetical protein